LDTPGLISADSKESPKAATQTEEERPIHSRIEQQLALDGAGFGNMSSTPMQRRSLTSDMLKETNNMAMVTSKVVVKMNKLERRSWTSRWRC
jgi:hypothetical protein